MSRFNAFKLNDVTSWLLVLSVVGYAPVGLIGSIVGVGFAPAFRGIVLLAASRVMFVKMRPWPVPLLLFFTGYAIRLMVDWAAGADGDPLNAMVFFVATVLLPSLAVCNARDGEIDWRATGWRFVALGGLTCIGALAGLLLGLDMSSRDTGRLEADKLNTISLGHVAATTVLACLTLMRGSRRIQRLWLAVFAAAALWTLLMTAARGPLVALAVCVCIYCISTRRIFIPLLLLAGIGYVFSDPESIVRIRFETLLSSSMELDLAATERLVYQARALGQFAISPILGSSFAELTSGSYPHNLFVEVLMAMGITGAVLLLVVLWQATRGTYRLLRRKELLPALLFIQYLVGAQFSGGIWNSGATWVMVAVVTTYAMRRRRQVQYLIPTPGQLS